MKEAENPYKKLVLVCVNEREPGVQCCKHRGSFDLYHKLKLAVAAHDPEIRVSRTGCLANCSTGITVVIQPDNRWLGHVTENDIDEIISML